MRPKKNVLLYCAEADLGDHLAWVLDIRMNGVRMAKASSPELFLTAAMAANAEFDCVVVVRTKLGERPLAYGRKCADAQVFALLEAAGVRMLTVEVQNGLPPRQYSNANRFVMGSADKAVAEILDAVKMACERKRGPIGKEERSRGFRLGMIGRAA